MNRPSASSRASHLSMGFLVLLLAFFLSSSIARAGGGPAGVIVIYNPNDPRSVTIANHYQQVRGIPESNMVAYVFPTTFTRITAWNFVYSLRQTLAARGLNPQVQSLALAGITPLDSSQMSASGSYKVSIQSFLLAAPGFGEAGFPNSTVTDLNGLYAGDAPFSGDAPVGTRALTAKTVAAGRTYWPVSSIGFPGKSGNSPREILGFLNRAKQNDGAKPTGGTIYWPLNSDVRSTTRAPEIPVAVPVWSSRGISYQILGNPANTSLTWVSDRNDIQGGIVGIARFTNVNNTFLPGAWVDHLTSNGGILDSFTTGQTSAGAWLRAGADGTSGTMAEPYAIAAKFPHANIHTHLRSGASMVEAFWQSIKWANEIICLADPLAQPFADFPIVTVSSPGEGAVLHGTVNIVASASATGNKVLEADLDLFVDGRRVAIGEANESVLAARTAGGFTLDTTTLSDGWHELRVAAYNNDSVRTQTEIPVGVQVNNLGQSLTLIAPASINPDGIANFSVASQGLTDLTSLILQSNGRTLANLPVSGGTVTVSGSLAPLDGNWNVYAIGSRANGQKVSSAPATVSVLWPAMAANNASQGTAMADVRYFTDTQATGFDWNTTAPAVVATFSGNTTTGEFVLEPTNITGITPPSDFAKRPGYDMTFQFYAPVDDWYEFGYDGGSIRMCAVNGVDLPEQNLVFGPRRLAPGWHTVRARVTFASSWSKWTIRVRGGSSQDFVPLTKAMCSNAGTGTAADSPTISSIIPGASPVITASTLLTANATIGGETAEELAALSYRWSRISGPQSVAFSANDSNVARTSTATFSAAGTYVIGLRVSGPSGSTFSSLTLPVQQTATGLSLTTGLITSAVRGAAIPLLAFTRDQFGRRMNVMPTVHGQPTMVWTTTDPAGTISALNASGEDARYVSLSGVTANQSFTVTATGTNGRTGSATSASLTITPRAPMTSSSMRLFTISQGEDGQWRFQPTATAANEASAVLTYAWSVLGVPPGGSLVLSGSQAASITGVALGAGTYSVRLVVTDPAGSSLTEDQSFRVAADQSFSSLPNFSKIASGISGAVDTEVSLSIPPSTAFNTPITGIQWQTSSDVGATWVDVSGATNSTWRSGPLLEGDDGKLIRVRVSSAAGETISNTATLSVSGSSQASVGIVGAESHQVINEDVGTLNIVIRRYGPTTEAASVNYSIEDFGATAGVDYLGVGGEAIYSGTVSWENGDSSDRVLSLPIIDDTEIEDVENIYVSIDDPVGVILKSRASWIEIEITDNDGPGKASFASGMTSVRESDGHALLAVQRSVGQGSLTVGYTTVAGSAKAGVDFTPSSGNITWANGDFAPKQIAVPILQDELIEGTENFTVTLAADPLLLGDVTTTTVAVQDAPYQQWQEQWWPTLLPDVSAYPDYPTALWALSPDWTFRFSEPSGTSLAGVNAEGATVAMANLATTGVGGSYALQGIGPRSPFWAGLEPTNSALSLVATGSSGTPALFTAGGHLNAGTANGMGSKLGQGFTLSAFVKTSVTDRVMTLFGGESNGTILLVTLNQAFGAPSSITPHSLRIFVGTGGKAAEYSATLSNLASGSLCDGQWHHVAVTLPAFTADTKFGDSARFFFDGKEVTPLGVRGAENIGPGLVFNDFTTVGLRVGANRATTATGFFNGLLDEVSFFSKTLAPQEIWELAAAQPAAALPAALAESASPTGDGIPNLMKYALGLNPLIPVSAGNLTTVAINGNELDFSFTRLREASDITYRVERSLNLSPGSWMEVWNSSGDPYGSEAPAVTESLIFDLQGLDKAFFRLKISKP